MNQLFYLSAEQLERIKPFFPLSHVFIGFLVRRGYGQFVRDDGPNTHLSKRGTPTMGGVVIVSVVVLAYALAHLATWEIPSYSGLLLLGLLVSTGVLGFIDDWTKITNKRSLGLTGRGKLLGQLAIGLVFGAAAVFLPDGYGVTSASRAISFTRDIDWLRLPASKIGRASCRERV